MFLLHSYVWLFATPWAVACLAPLSMEFFRQELEWLPLLSPGDLPNPGIEPGSPSLQTDSLPSEPPGKPIIMLRNDNHFWKTFHFQDTSLVFILTFTIKQSVMRQRFYRWGNKLNESNVGTGIPCLLHSQVMLVKKKLPI